jgi:glycosyltransferase involved in cell wall biosynthesis
LEIVLIGNYTADQQESMERFAMMLYKGLCKMQINATIVKPSVLLGKMFHSTTNGLGKWFGYIDKWILFPLVLLFKNNRHAYYHICDHSNAFYLKFLPKARSSITCHDVLAIKGALGDKSAHCEASFTGQLLQKWILKNLKKAKKIAAVSSYTLQELKLITDNADNENKHWRVIYNGFNQLFGVMPKEDVFKVLKRYSVDNKPFLLHVGSALPRKNRKLLVKILKQTDNADLVVVFAGKAIDEPLMQAIDHYQLQNRCISIEHPSHEELTALYNQCAAFIFPSYSEGFGWPVIEAQACGAPIITSNLKPMTEIGGQGALYADPGNAISFIACFNALKDEDFKASLIQKGFENTRRFSTANMLKQYLNLITATA